MSANRLTWLEYFAKELIAWREFRGLTQEQLAQAINYSPSQVAMVETCQRTPKPEFIKSCDAVMETGGALIRLYDELVSREVTPDYLNRWQGIIADASEINSFQPLVVHGLLQTPDYARAVLRSGPPSAADIDAKVQSRLARQEILTRDDPPMFVCVMDEGILRRPVGGRKVIGEQLHYLAEQAQQPHIRLHVVPNDTGEYAGLAGPFTIATIDGEDYVYLDNALTGQVTESTLDVATMKRMWESLRAEALPRPASLRMIQEAADQWTA
ncbi:helix-turn-helix domain-containing protein [Actinomadura sp. 3N508]|uniref:helix-turn-helix domain-containing protein n=1 Tax=Actinomadura sp. 3N508 TaxID=3375153 RepID=UPI0037BB0A9B